MAEGGEAVRVPFGMGAGGAVCVESRKCGSGVGDVGSGSEGFDSVQSGL